MKIVAFDLCVSLTTGTPPGLISLLSDSIHLIKSILESNYSSKSLKEVISLSSGMLISKTIDKFGVFSKTASFLFSSTISNSLQDCYELVSNKLVSICDKLGAGLVSICKKLGTGGIEFKNVGSIVGINLPEIILCTKSNLFFETEYETEVREAFNSLCLPEFQNRTIKEYYQTIIREIYDGVNIIGELPFVSLHFNKDHLLYSVMDPYYKNTLIGNLLAYLDYFLKGFVNGGFFNIDFIKKWVNLPPQERLKDLKKLNEFLIDVKKIIKKNLNNYYYKTLYDLIGQEKITEDLSTAFRIIGEMKSINYCDGIFLPKSSFTIEYDINLTPQLQKSLATGKSQNEDFRNIAGFYHQMKDIIKNVMPKIPQFRGFFIILDMITCAIHYTQSLFALGKKIETSNSFQATSPKKPYVDIIPEVFPPLPVFARQKISPSITLGEILEILQGTSLNKEIKCVIYDQQKEFSEILQIELINRLKSMYKNKISSILKDDFYRYDDDDLHLNDFMGKSLSFLIRIPQMLKDYILSFLSHLIQELNELMPEKTNYTDISLLKNFDQIENECRKVFNLINDYLSRKKNIMCENEKILRKNIEILNQNETEIIEQQNKMNSIPLFQRKQPEFNNAIDELTKELNDTRQKRNTTNQNIIECRQHLLSINNHSVELLTKINDFSNASRSFLQYYKKVLNHQQKIHHEFFVSKPQIASFENGKSIEGGCLINFRQNPLLFYTPKSSNLIKNIISFISKNSQLQEYMRNKDCEQGFIISLDIGSLYQEGFLFSKSQNNDFLRYNELDYNKSNIYHLAAKLNIKNCLETINEKELNSETADKMTYAFIACCNGNIIATDILNKKGADFGKVLTNGVSPFLAAIQLGHYSTVLYLLQNNANLGDINISTEIGMTPLHWAVYHCYTDIIELLLKRNASFNIGLKSSGMTPTHFSCYLNKVECLSILDKLGATNYKETSAGFTPLHISIENSLNCAYFLIKNKKCDLNTLDPYGNTIHDIAIINGQYDIADILPKVGRKKEILNKVKKNYEENDYFKDLLNAFESGNPPLAEIMYEKWMKRNKNKIILTKEQENLLINSCCLGRSEEFIEILSRIINFEDSVIALYAARYGLINWISEIIKYNGNLMIEINQRNIFDEAIENHDHEFIKAAYYKVEKVSIQVLKRIIKRSIEINDLNLMNVISNSFKDHYFKLEPRDILFPFSTVQSFIIFQQYIDPNIEFKLNDFIELISYEVASYLIDEYRFTNDCLFLCMQKLLVMKKHDISFLIINQYQNLAQNSTLNNIYPIMKKINKENQKIIIYSLFSILKDDKIPNTKKITQFKGLFENIFYIGDIPCFNGLNLLSIAGQSSNCLWILKVLQKDSLKSFRLSHTAFQKDFIFNMLNTILNTYEDSFDMKNAGKMFLNCLTNLDFDELDLNGFGDEFATSLLELMTNHHFNAVDDNNQTIFHIIAKFKHIKIETKEKIIQAIRKRNDPKIKEFIKMKSISGEDILLAFSSTENYSILKNLLDLGANINCRNIFGENALHKIIGDRYSSNNSVIDIVSHLIKLSSSLIIEKDRKGESPFMLAAKKGFNGVLGLMSTYYPMNILDSSPKRSIIHLAAKSNYPLTIRYIVQNLHIDVNIKSKKGYTALHYAALYNSIDAFVELLSLGGNPLISTNNCFNYTSIDFALMHGSEEMINMIMKRASFNVILASPKILPDLVFNQESYLFLKKNITYY